MSSKFVFEDEYGKDFENDDYLKFSSFEKFKN